MGCHCTRLFSRNYPKPLLVALPAVGFVQLAIERQRVSAADNRAVGAAHLAEAL